MAEDFTLPIKVGGNAVMFAPNPKADPHIEWSLRYSTNLGDPRCGRFSAAAVVESFAYLLSDSINMTEATRRLRVMRAVVREHVAGLTTGEAPKVIFCAGQHHEACPECVKAGRCAIAADRVMGTEPVAWRYPIGGGRYAATTSEADARSASTDGTVEALGIIAPGVEGKTNG